MKYVLRGAMQPLLISGLEVRVLRGSPLFCNDLARFAFSCRLSIVGTFVWTHETSTRRTASGSEAPGRTESVSNDKNTSFGQLSSVK